MWKALAGGLLLFFVTSCVVARPARDGTSLDSNSLALRQIQSRTFETSDETTVLRSVVSAMQDLGMKIEKADHGLKIVEGQKVQRVRGIVYSRLTVNVSIRPHGKKRTLVRVAMFTNIENGSDMKTPEKPDNDPVAYQNFFATLQKTLFLDAHTIDE